jgi:hypothetical protein
VVADKTEGYNPQWSQDSTLQNDIVTIECRLPERLDTRSTLSL